MKKDEKSNNNVFELLELMKKYKRRIAAGALAATLIGGAAISEVLKGNDKQDFSLPEDPKDSIESIEPAFNFSGGSSSGIIGRINPNFVLPEDENKVLPELSDDEISQAITEGEKSQDLNESETNEDDLQTTIDTGDKNSSLVNNGTIQTIKKEIKPIVEDVHRHTLTTSSVVYDYNGDNTHTTTTITGCVTCDYVSKLEEVNDCTFTIKEYDKDYEYKACTQCGEEIKVTHDYGVGIDNLDGTTTYACIHEDCFHELVLPTPGYTVEDHICEYGKAVITYKDITPSKHTVVSTQECLDPDCDEPLKVVFKTVKHSFDSGVINNGKITYTCGDCGYQKVRNYSYDNNNDNDYERPSRPSHSHSFGEEVITYKDITEEGHTVVSTSSCTGCSSVRENEVKASHEFDEGVLNEDGTKIIFTCRCGYKKTQDYVPEDHVHDYKENITYKDFTDTEHTKVSTKECDVPDCDNPTIIFEEVLPHGFDEGTLNGAETEITYTCDDCGYQKTEDYDHVHSDVPSDLVYTFDSSNKNGTHNLVASYSCTKCGEEIVDTKLEDCDYTTTYESIGITNPTNIHNVINTCDVCNYETKTTGSCTKTGDMQFIKIYDNIYEYYDCADCHGYVDRDYHTNHVYGEWEMDMTNHIRYCGCVEAREEGYHDFDKDTNSCKECGYVLDHDHAPDNMDLIDLIMSPYYDQLDSKRNFTNPNPNPSEYCYRYDITCHTCRVPYRIEYDHHYDENGVCHRTDCGVLDPNFVPSSIFELDENSYDVVDNENSFEEALDEGNSFADAQEVKALKNVLKLERILDNRNY